MLFQPRTLIVGSGGFPPPAGAGRLHMPSSCRKCFHCFVTVVLCINHSALYELCTVRALGSGSSQFMATLTPPSFCNATVPEQEAFEAAHEQSSAAQDQPSGLKNPRDDGNPRTAITQVRMSTSCVVGRTHLCFALVMGFG